MVSFWQQGRWTIETSVRVQIRFGWAQIANAIQIWTQMQKCFFFT
jgi:hypothetical protein